MRDEQAFRIWMKDVDAVFVATIGLGALDMADAPYADYFADEMTPREAAACAMTDYCDVPSELMGDLEGLV